MNLLNKLTKKNLLLNKKRTIVTVIGIILSVALITALSSLVVSFKYSALNYEKTRSGNYHVSFRGVGKEDVLKLKDNRYIEDVYFSNDIGYAILDDIKNEDKPYVFVKAFDFKALENTSLNLIEGRMPLTSNEIVIPRHLKTNGRVYLKVGDTLKLDIGRRLSDNYELNQSNPYQKEDEVFVKDTTKEYKIVGIIERPSYNIESYSAPGYTLVTVLDKMSDSSYIAYVRYKHEYLKDYYGTTASILGIDKVKFKKYMTGNYPQMDNEDEYLAMVQDLREEVEKGRYQVNSINSYLISLEYQNLEDNTMRSLYMVAGIVTMIIIVTSVFCIRNSFNISITEKTKQYGMLASVGATRKQIKRNVLYEAFILGLIGIPIGLLSGILASFILIKIATFLLFEALSMNFSFRVSIYSLILSAFLGAITIYISAIRSARKASRISPIAAIRNNDDIKIKSKKIKSPKLVKKLFGIGGDVSYKNLKRNNKKYRTTVISIVVCVAVFISLYSFMDLAFKSVHMSFKELNHNIDLAFQEKNNDKAKSIIDELISMDGVKDYTIYNSNGYELEKPKYTKEYAEGRPETNEDGKNDAYITLISLGEHQYKKYVSKLGLKYDDVKDEGILINNTYKFVYDEKKNSFKNVEVDIYDYQVGDVINGKYHDLEACKQIKGDSDEECWINAPLTIGTITSLRPLGIENIYMDSAYMVISDELMSKMNTSSYYQLYLDTKNADKYQDDAEKLLTSTDDSHITNYDKEAKQQTSLFTLVAIFLYGFITVIALIGITNIFNTITTSVELRAREFATLKSVGMTKKEFNRMISLESIFYGSKSLIIGIPVGTILSYLIYKALMDGDIEFAYNIPIKAILISIIAVLLLITVIMKYSIRKINKQNTIETIRNDNI